MGIPTAPWKICIRISPRAPTKLFRAASQSMLKPTCWKCCVLIAVRLFLHKNFRAIYIDLIRHLRDHVFDTYFVSEKIPVIRCVLRNQENRRPLCTFDGARVATHSALLFTILQDKSTAGCDRRRLRVVRPCNWEPLTIAF